MRSIIEDGYMQLAMNWAKFLISFLSMDYCQKSSMHCSDFRLKDSYLSVL